MPTLTLERAKLNPAFEAYRLAPASNDALIRTSLETPVIPTGPSNHAPLALPQVQARALYNHLAFPHVEGENNCASRALFVDASRQVTEVSLEEDDLHPHTRVVYALPDVIDSPAFEGPDPELPSVAAASDSVWLVTDGRGTLNILDISPSRDREATLLSSHDILETTGQQHRLLPFVLYAAMMTDDKHVSALILSARKIPKEHRDPKTHRTVNFYMQVLIIPLSPDSRPNVAWAGQTSDAPTHAFRSSASESFVVCTRLPLESPDVEEHPPPPSVDEIVPIPRAGESLDEPRAPPYHWTQTSESISLTIDFPPSPPLRASSFRISILPSSLTIALSDSPTTPILPTSLLWGPIDSSASTWTFDSTTNTLTLELEKSHAGTRWPEIFSSTVLPSVPETLDAAQMDNIRDALAKHTADVDNDDFGAQAIPSLARGEADDEVDDESGPAHYITHIPATSADSSVPKNDTTPIGLLAGPIPGLSHPAPSIVSKHGLDGALFSLSNGQAWIHNTTFPALAFVLASKREVRFALHAGSRGVLALEAGSAARGAGNVYWYQGGQEKEKYGKQTIVRVGGGGVVGGMLLGVGVLKAKNSHRRGIVCLCEREVVVIRGLEGL